jgi:ABC-type transport system involved in Fe-S cluster assembly fused permease/ATPase subunit
VLLTLWSVILFLPPDRLTLLAPFLCMLSHQVTYLCLYLIPAFLECLAVCFFFIFKFQEWQLSGIVIIGVSIYTVITILITSWRKQFRSDSLSPFVSTRHHITHSDREASNKHDNDYHDKATDSIVNYEVKGVIFLCRVLTFLLSSCSSSS